MPLYKYLSFGIPLKQMGVSYYYYANKINEKEKVHILSL